CRLARAIDAHTGALLESLHADLGRSARDAYVMEIGFVQSEIRYALRHLRAWMRSDRRPVPPILWPGRGLVHPEPLGVVLIIGPWNYPFQLLFTPLVSALAAGNCVALKPSEYAPCTAAVMRRIVADGCEPEHVGYFEGAAAAAADLTHLPFDHIFFTGSVATGRRVMAAAAQGPVSVTLELGGKNPCVVCADARLDQAARRIARGKFMNAGQTCVAPDFVMVAADLLEPLLDKLAATISDFYGPDPRLSPDYGRIINDAHFQRLQACLSGGRIVCGGQSDRTERYLAPTVMRDLPPDAPVLSEEIFGPILPVLAFDELDEVFAYLRHNAKPLALYCFTESGRVRRRFLAETASGGLAFNDTVNHLLAKTLPFGGVGASGIGACHGAAGFAGFTHYRSVLHRSSRLDCRWLYPPLKTPLHVLKRFYGFLLGG
ncbi:MAG: aldehyde dehydrogenase family protein, partial [Kiritimatiellia bacterium]